MFTVLAGEPDSILFQSSQFSILSFLTPAWLGYFSESNDA